MRRLTVGLVAAALILAPFGVGRIYVVCVMCFPEGVTRLRLRSRRA